MDKPETMRVIYNDWPQLGPVVINVKDYDSAAHTPEQQAPKKRGRRPAIKEIDTNGNR